MLGESVDTKLPHAHVESDDRDFPSSFLSASPGSPHRYYIVARSLAPSPTDRLVPWTETGFFESFLLIPTRRTLLFIVLFFTFSRSRSSRFRERDFPAATCVSLAAISVVFPRGDLLDSLDLSIVLKIFAEDFFSL